MAHELTNFDKCDITRSDYNWPGDLLKPDVVIFLVVSEEVRRYRHAYRNTTNTKEEQLLASNGIFRQKYVRQKTMRIAMALFLCVRSNL